MHSSTFNSSEAESPALAPAAERPKPASAKQGIVLLLAGLVAIFLGLEVASPLILARLSHTEQRITSEMREVRQLRRMAADGRPTVLILGNSLLLEGVQIDNLRSNTASQYAVTRLGIEQTHYLDWYFGIRRLLKEGVRPNTIILSLATDQLASKFTLGESFAHRQMAIRDFPLVVKESRLDRTTASSYFLAHWSNWLGDKGFIRQCLMILLVPNFRQLAGRIADHGPHVDDPDVLLNMAKQRLPELRQLADEYQVRIVLLVPPSLREDHSREVQDLGAQIGLPVWVLSPPGEFSRQLYRDGFHLNAQGSQIFTERLSQQIRSLQNSNAVRDHSSPEMSQQLAR
jgi:hypothetical protein